MKTMRSISTSMKKGSAEVSTALTFDWDGITVEVLIPLVERTIVIALQNRYRMSGVIPATDDVNVVEFTSRKRGVMTIEQKRAYAAKLMAELAAFDAAQ